MRNRLKLIVLFLVIVFLGVMGCLIMDRVKKKKIVAERVRQFPDFTLYRADGEKLVTEELSYDQPIILIYFNSTCYLCQKEIEAIKERLEEFEDVQILLVSSEQVKVICKFAKRMELNNCKNIHWFQDKGMEVAVYYDIGSVPEIFLYDRSGSLVRSYQGTVKVDKLLDSF
ncbi:peroxiredoxin family protein [Echinicola salinicaeni]|uniref:peroxiredoxin family protein n=1 Tax=Echinicola salinicaeni TaxID=2762757 RepID=UPI00164929CF|nr:redoxin domain-containing protein [Echinicola salinicaeni]